MTGKATRLGAGLGIARIATWINMLTYTDNSLYFIYIMLMLTYAEKSSLENV